MITFILLFLDKVNKKVNMRERMKKRKINCRKLKSGNKL